MKDRRLIKTWLRRIYLWGLRNYISKNKVNRPIMERRNGKEGNKEKRPNMSSV